jgi:hypothetical protein
MPRGIQIGRLPSAVNPASSTTVLRPRWLRCEGVSRRTSDTRREYTARQLGLARLAPFYGVVFPFHVLTHRGALLKTPCIARFTTGVSTEVIMVSAQT